MVSKNQLFLKPNVSGRQLLLGLVILAAIAFAGCSGETGRGTANAGQTAARTMSFSNQEDVAEVLRSGLRTHSKTLKVSFFFEEDILAELPDAVDTWMEAALAETDEPDEGDYIRYQIGGYEKTCSYEKDAAGYRYIIIVTPVYYQYMAQEEQVGEAITDLFSELGIRQDLSDAEKVSRIYSYLCRNVRYDKVHKKNPYYYLRSTSYAALVQKTATCQGYSVALYRLLKEAGVNSRIVTGSSSGDDLHAWNIVQLEGAWYYLDATWDAAAEAEDYQYFLKGTDHFEDHVLDPAFLAEDFQSSYPVSKPDYRINE